MMNPSDRSQTAAGQEGLAAASAPRRLARTLALLALVTAVYVLHQDFWNWKSIEPLLFGFLPVGLAYHVGYSIVAALMMAVLVRFAWPAHLEKYEAQEPSAHEKHGDGRS
jgi:hypothetical protein